MDYSRTRDDTRPRLRVGPAAGYSDVYGALRVEMAGIFSANHDLDCLSDDSDVTLGSDGAASD